MSPLQSTGGHGTWSPRTGATSGVDLWWWRSPRWPETTPATRSAVADLQTTTGTRWQWVFEERYLAIRALVSARARRGHRCELGWTVATTASPATGPEEARAGTGFRCTR